MATTHDIGSETAPEHLPRRRRSVLVLAAAALAVGGLAAGLSLGLGGSSLPPESANPQRDIVGSWVCTWPGYTAHVTVAQDLSATFSSTALAGGVSVSSGNTTKLFIGPKEMVAGWEVDMPEYSVHIRESQMILGDPSQPGETCTRK
jgi:hypothetical protein